MAVTVLRYPGGLEYPEFWKSNVQGLTPTGSYTLSFDQALSKFPGLQYDAQFNALKNSQSTQTSPDTQFNDDAFYQYEQELDTYNKSLEADKQKQAALSKAVDDKRAVYLSGLKDPAAIRAALDELQGAIKASSDYAISTMGKFTPPKAPTGYKPTGRPLPTPTSTFTPSPETQKNVEILQQQAASGNTESKQFLDNYVGSNETLVAQNQGPSTPVKYDEQMKQFVPNPGAGRPGEVRLKTPPPFAQGPRGEIMGDVASILPPAMSQGELYRAIQDYSRPGGPAKGSELRDLQQEWIRRQKLKGAEAPGAGPRGEALIAQNQGPSTPVKYDEQMNMFVPNQGGGRPANIRLKNTPVREAQAPAFDEQKALIAAQAAGSYRKRGDVEDPFRAAAFG